MLVGALGWVGVGDESDVGVGEGLRGFAILELDCVSQSSMKRGRGLQVGPDVYIASRHLVGTYEDVSAVSSSTINTDGVFASVSRGGIERDLSTLVAVRRIRCPSALVPSLLEPLRDLSNSERRKSERKESSLTKHD